jgi:dTDP-4-amino-4,6-dideoxygalactose transaminase
MASQKTRILLHQNQGGWYYEMQALGYNYRLTDIQAALGISQLKRADEGLHKRRQIASAYYEAFKSRPFILGQSGSGRGTCVSPVYYSRKERKALYDYLRKQIFLPRFITFPVSYTSILSGFRIEKYSFACSENYYAECLSLPMYPTLLASEQQYVIDSILNFHHER